MTKHDGKAPADYGLLVLDQLLLVLMLIELLHTVRISVRSEAPFLVVGSQGTERQREFRNSMIELGLFGFLTLVFVFAIYLFAPLVIARRDPRRAGSASWPCGPTKVKKTPLWGRLATGGRLLTGPSGEQRLQRSVIGEVETPR